MMYNSPNFVVAKQYALDVCSGKLEAGRRRKLSCRRFLNDLQSNEFDFKTEQFDFAIDFIQNSLVHKKGEDKDGNPLPNTPFILMPWQIFVIVNLLGFFVEGKNIRRFTECLIMLPRKNGKSPFASALSLTMAIINSSSNSVVYILANSLKQTRETFDFLLHNVNRFNTDNSFTIRDNNNEHRIYKEMRVGSFEINALAAKEDNLDSFNGNFIIIDEVHAMRGPKKYKLMKDAQRAYRNKLLTAISTAGDKPNGFLARRVKYCDKVLEGTLKKENYFIFICDADVDEDGEIKDFTNPKYIRQANPSLGVTVQEDELLGDAFEALNDPQTRQEFFNKTLNIFTTSFDAYFNVNEFITSDSKYNWTIDELAKLPIKWYGGVDLSKLHDLTAAVLYGNYKGVDIIIPHAFFPKVAATAKAEEDGIPLFAWESDGILTMSQTNTVHHDDVVKWFKTMKSKGFKIKKIGFDKKFGREFFKKMKRAGFTIVDAPQYFWRKSEGFRHIEVQAKEGKLYYCHADSFIYCVSNVKAIEKVDDMIQYEKIEEHSRIDVFDAAVFAAVQRNEDLEVSGTADAWLRKGGKVTSGKQE